MLLVIDSGNTNTVFAVFEANPKRDVLLGQWRLSTNARRTADEYAVLLEPMLRMKGISVSQITAAMLSTVVPQNLFSLKTLCRNYFSCEPMVIGDERVKLGIDIMLERPSEVGADRLVNAVAAFQKYQQSLIVIDFGTATNFDVIGSRGEYLGGAIAPGINLSLDALRQAAAKLPQIDVARPKNVIGNSTIPAMQSGIYWGYVGLLEGITRRIKAEYGLPMRVIATGGLAPLFAEGTDCIDVLEPDLTIVGLKEVFNRNS